MKSRRAFTIAAALPIAIAVIFSPMLCCKGEPEGPPVRTPTPLDPATTGSIEGSIFYDGEPPLRRPLSMGGDTACKSPEPILEEHAIVNPKNGRFVVRNAFLWISSGLGDRVFAYPETPVVVDQKNCVFIPHVAGIQRYQTLVFKNSDPTQHNMNFVEHGKNPGHNFSLAAQGHEKSVWFPEEAVPMKVICNAHSWMTMYIGCVDHPYFAVTGDDGAFRLPNVPAGEYTLSCWHEYFGRKDAKVAVDAKGAARMDFTFTKK